MKVLGKRIKARRKLLRLNQKDVAGHKSASFLSKVETGQANPSLKNLKEWSETLQTTQADLIGDDLILEAAKYTIFEPTLCKTYLNNLPKNKTTKFILSLTNSVQNTREKIPNPPNDPELILLTSQVYIKRGELIKAKELLEESLKSITYHSPLTGFYHLALLCHISKELSNEEEQKILQTKLTNTLKELKETNYFHSLPSSSELTQLDLDHIKLSYFLNQLTHKKTT